MRPASPIPPSSDLLSPSSESDGSSRSAGDRRAGGSDSPGTHPPGGRALTPLFPILAVTVIGSFGTSVFWNAIGFIAKNRYDFTSEQTLVLYIAMGIVYVVGAWSASATLARLTGRCTARTLTVILLVALAAACFLPAIAQSAPLFWFAGLLASYVSSLLWPIVHAYLSAGRHGAAMRRGIGIFNVTWMIAVALPLLTGGHLLKHHPHVLLIIVGALTLAAVVPALRFALTPADHGDDPAGHVPMSYRPLAASARRLLPLSYVFVGAVSPIAPYRCEDLGIPDTTAAPLTATWMITRLLVVTMMLLTHGWAGRWSLLLGSGICMVCGFAVFAAGTTAWHLYAGLALLGIGLGATYHAALYYGMAVGRAEVDAGGRHEAMIGGGYVLGPAAALFGAALAQNIEGLRADAATVASVTVLAIIGLIIAALPWYRASRGLAI